MSRFVTGRVRRWPGAAAASAADAGPSAAAAASAAADADAGPRTTASARPGHGPVVRDAAGRRDGLQSDHRSGQGRLLLSVRQPRRDVLRQRTGTTAP